MEFIKKLKLDSVLSVEAELKKDDNHFYFRILCENGSQEELSIYTNEMEEQLYNDNSSVIVELLSGGKYEIVALSKELSEIFNIKKGDGIESLENYFKLLDFKEKIDRCIELEHTIKYIYVKENDDEPFCYVITFLPVYHPKGFAVVFLTKIVNKIYDSSIKNTADSRQKKIEKFLEPLTKREKEVALKLIAGDTIKYISYSLGIAEGTVKKTIHNIYRKTGVNSRVDLIRMFFDE